jgi:pyruvate formate lyase activating enzyme
VARSDLGLGGERGVITEILRFSVNNGPGIRTTVFLKGCRLRCKWCHNPEGVRHYPEVFHFWPNCVDCGDCDEVCPSGAMTLLGKEEWGGDVRKIEVEGEELLMKFSKKMVRKIRIDKALCIGCLRCVEACKHDAFVVAGEFTTVDKVMDEVKKDSVFYEVSGGGMTLSGGEPTAQPDFCYALLKAAKEAGLHTALDTNGYIDWDTLSKLLDYTDLVLYDIKLMDSEAHKEFSGASNEIILENAERIAKRGTEMRVRVPVIPNVNDSKRNLEETAKFAKSLGVEFVDLLPYHPYAGQKYRQFSLDFPYPIGVGYPEEKLEELRKIFETQGLKTTIGG